MSTTASRHGLTYDPTGHDDDDVDGADRRNALPAASAARPRPRLVQLGATSTSTLPTRNASLHRHDDPSYQAVLENRTRNGLATNEPPQQQRDSLRPLGQGTATVSRMTSTRRYMDQLDEDDAGDDCDYSDSANDRATWHSYRAATFAPNVEPKRLASLDVATVATRPISPPCSSSSSSTPSPCSPGDAHPVVRIGPPSPATDAFFDRAPESTHWNDALPSSPPRSPVGQRQNLLPSTANLLSSTTTQTSPSPPRAHRVVPETPRSKNFSRPFANVPPPPPLVERDDDAYGGEQEEEDDNHVDVEGRRERSIHFATAAASEVEDGDHPSQDVERSPHLAYASANSPVLPFDDNGTTRTVKEEQQASSIFTEALPRSPPADVAAFSLAPRPAPRPPSTTPPLATRPLFLLYDDDERRPSGSPWSTRSGAVERDQVVSPTTADELVSPSSLIPSSTSSSKSRNVLRKPRPQRGREPERAPPSSAAQVGLVAPPVVMMQRTSSALSSSSSLLSSSSHSQHHAVRAEPSVKSSGGGGGGGGALGSLGRTWAARFMSSSSSSRSKSKSRSRGGAGRPDHHADKVVYDDDDPSSSTFFDDDDDEPARVPSTTALRHAASSSSSSSSSSATIQPRSLIEPRPSPPPPMTTSRLRPPLASPSGPCSLSYSHPSPFSSSFSSSLSEKTTTMKHAEDARRLLSRAEFAKLEQSRPAFPRSKSAFASSNESGRRCIAAAAAAGGGRGGRLLADREEPWKLKNVTGPRAARLVRAGQAEEEEEKETVSLHLAADIAVKIDATETRTGGGGRGGRDEIERLQEGDIVGRSASGGQDSGSSSDFSLHSLARPRSPLGASQKSGTGSNVNNNSNNNTAAVAVVGDDDGRQSQWEGGGGGGGPNTRRASTLTTLEKAKQTFHGSGGASGRLGRHGATARMMRTPSGNENRVVAVDPVSPEDFLQVGIDHHEAGQLERAAWCFEQSAKLNGGCGAGMLMHGLTLRHGWGCQTNAALGFRYLEMAAESVVQDLDRVVFGGRTLTESEANTKAAKSELVLALHEIGVSYRFGWGVEKNKTMAVSYFTLSADLGDVDAQQDVAICLASGKGCKKDLKRAAHYYRLAVDQGAESWGLSWIYKPKYMDV